VSGLGNAPGFGNVRESIYDGTRCVYTDDTLGDSCTVRAMIVVDTDNVNPNIDGPVMIRRAVDAYVSEQPRRQFSPGHTLLPIKRITGRQVARNLVELFVEYGGRSVVGDGTNVASYEVITYPTPVYTKAANPDGDGKTYSRGLPFGTYIDGRDTAIFVDKSEIQTLRTKQFPRNCVRIKIARSQIGQNPVETYGPHLRKTNSMAISFAGYSFPAGTLLLEGVTSNAKTIGTIDPTGQTPPELLMYNYNLSLIHDQNKFPMQGFNVASKDEDTGEALEFAVAISDEYEQSNWNLDL
tara:strand:- start:7748 stop:8635 length:888 start_codon:yes stop_codon:yes gene_type:complete